MVKKVKDIAKFFHSSTIATNALRDHRTQQSQMNKIKQDVDPQWNSTFKMLESYDQPHKEIRTITVGLYLMGINT